MKKILFTILLLSISFITCAQQFAFGVRIDPNATIKDGLNVGLSIEHYQTFYYIKASSFLFPQLRGTTYIDLMATGGFSHIINKHRGFAGAGGGFIYRDTYGYPSVKFEFGYQYFISKDVSLGLTGDYTYRTDYMYSSADPKFAYSTNFGVYYNF